MKKGSWFIIGISVVIFVSLWLKSNIVSISDVSIKNAVGEKLHLSDSETEKTTLHFSKKMITSISSISVEGENIDLIELKQFSGLHHLTIEPSVLSKEEPKYSINITGLDVLENMNGVKEVQIIYAKNIEHPGVFKNVKVLSLYYCGISNTDELSQCIELEELYLCSEVDDYSFLKEMVNLKVLEISANDDTFDFQLLQYLPNLERLDLKGITLEQDEFELICKYNKKLQALYIYNGNLENINNIDNLSDLNALYLIDCDVENAEPLKTLHELKVLNISGNPLCYEDFQNICIYNRGLKQLFCSNTEIKRIDAIISLNELEDLDVSNCGIKDVRVLSSLDHIKTLVIDESSGAKEQLKEANIAVYYE